MSSVNAAPESTRAEPKNEWTSDKQVIEIPLDSGPLSRALTCVIVTLVVGGALANYAVYNVAPNPDHPIADVLKRFDLGHEPSIPAFYSATMMVVSAVFLFFLGRFDSSRHRKRCPYWYALSLLFLCLAIDESVMFHEMATAALNRLNLSGPFYFSWIVPGAIFAASVGLVMSRFLFGLDAKTRRGLILSGMVFLGGALGMEFVAGLIFGSAANEEAAISSAAHVIVQAIEEGLEMTGVAIFLCTLVDYARRHGMSISVCVDNSVQVSAVK